MIIVEQMIRNSNETEKNSAYIYRLVKNTVKLSLEFDSIEVQSYGIEVERQDKVDGALVNIERDAIYTISPYRHKVHDLLKLLYDNEVSPIHLVEVVGEYVDEYIEDFDGRINVVAATN